MKKILLYIVLKEILNKEIENFSSKQLSELLIELDANNYNLTEIIEDLNGLSTPHLEYRLQELIIFNILNQSTLYYLTANGITYINEQTKITYENKEYKDFIELTGKLIDKVFLDEDKDKEKQQEFKDKLRSISKKHRSKRIMEKNKQEHLEFDKCPKCGEELLDTIDYKTYFCIDKDCGFVGEKESYCQWDMNTRS